MHHLGTIHLPKSYTAVNTYNFSTFPSLRSELRTYYLGIPLRRNRRLSMIELEDMTAFIDTDDNRFIRSYRIHEISEALDFFREYGFVVWRDLYSPEQCERTRAAMWNGLAQNCPGLKATDPHTWDLFKSNGKYGLSTRGPSFDPILVDNRQNPNLAVAMAAVLEISVSDLMTSHDRYTIYRATELAEWGLDGSNYRTGRENIHIDLNPWWYLESNNDVVKGIQTLQYSDPQDFVKENNFVVGSMGRHIQCVLNFSENLDEDGGTIVVPGFHKYAPRWTAENIQLKKSLPWVTFANDATGGPLAVEQELISKSVRVSMREGSVLMWDQLVAHGTRPNMSNRCRTAQFLKAFSRAKSFQDGIPPAVPFVTSREGDTLQRSEVDEIEILQQSYRIVRRSLALRNQLVKSGAIDIVTPLGASLFGLDILS